MDPVALKLLCGRCPESIVVEPGAWEIPRSRTGEDNNAGFLGTGGQGLRSTPVEDELEDATLALRARSGRFLVASLFVVLVASKNGGGLLTILVGDALICPIEGCCEDVGIKTQSGSSLGVKGFEGLLGLGIRLLCDSAIVDRARRPGLFLAKEFRVSGEYYYRYQATTCGCLSLLEEGRGKWPHSQVNLRRPHRCREHELWCHQPQAVVCCRALYSSSLLTAHQSH